MNPELDSLWKGNLARLEPYWSQVFNELGNTSTVLPMFGLGDDGLANASSFTTRQSHTNGIEAVFTWSEAPSAFDTAFDPTDEANWQGIVPVLKFNQSDEEADSPNNAYWSRDDSGSNPFSVGCWIKITGSGAFQNIFSKFRNTSTQLREWTFGIDSSEKLRFLVTDESAGVSAFRLGDSTIPTDNWRLLVATYDSAGGSAAANGMTLYNNGEVEASTATNNGSYVAMEASAALVNLGMLEVASGTLGSTLAGGPFGPFFTQVELTAAQVKNLYVLGRAAMGLK